MGGGHAAIGKYRGSMTILEATAFGKQLWYRNGCAFMGLAYFSVKTSSQ